MGLSITKVTTWGGTAILTVMEFVVPTATVSGSSVTVTNVPTDPTTVVLKWRWAGGTTNTWTYNSTGNITRLGTGNYEATISTATPPSNQIVGKWIGTEACECEIPFEITVSATPL